MNKSFGPGPMVKCPQCGHRFEYDKIEEEKREIKERFEKFDKGISEHPLGFPRELNKFLLEKTKQSLKSNNEIQYATKEDINKLLTEIEILRSNLVTLKEQLKKKKKR